MAVVDKVPVMMSTMDILELSRQVIATNKI